ncbi:MAG: hypothetical protein WBV73_00740 [Phormidium sp.]
MKGRSLLTFTVILTIFSASSLSVLAQSQRLFKKAQLEFPQADFIESEKPLLTPSRTSQKQHNTKFQQANTEDISAVLNLVRGWGAVENVFIIDNYAIVSYLIAQNGATVPIKRENGKWKIVNGKWRITSNDNSAEPTLSCRQVSCLVENGFPRNIATQLINRLENFDRTQQQQIATFRQAWAKTNRSIAPFLGYWRDMDWAARTQPTEISFSIWPSYTANKVCVVGIAENSQYVHIGTVSGKKITTPNNVFTLEESMGEGEGIKSQTENYLVNPAPLNTWYFNAETKKKLEDAGCTSSPPR